MSRGNPAAGRRTSILRYTRGAVTLALLLLLLLTLVSEQAAAKPKAKSHSPGDAATADDSGDASPAPPANAGAPAGAASGAAPSGGGPSANVTGPLPVDMNSASLRVAAMQTLYELDVSPEQARSLRAAAAPSTQTRTAVKRNPKLADALQQLANALQQRHDDQQIAQLRNQTVDMAVDLDVELDDQVQPTASARTKAATVCRQLGAGQIAAFLAYHADQLSDPVERMMGALSDMRSEASADSADEPAPDPSGAIQDTADTVARLVAGSDDAKEKAVADQVTAWFKASLAQKDEPNEAQHQALAESARKVVGDASGMEILGHWLESEVTVLLSNPQLLPALDAVANSPHHTR